MPREVSSSAVPAYEKLPKPKHRSRRTGPAVATFDARIEVVTPILGGSNSTRTTDDIDGIRAATVRGHLRFWASPQPNVGRGSAILVQQRKIMAISATTL
jgi:hypothetical protein